MFNRNQLESLLKDLNISNTDIIERIILYIENLKKWNKAINLTSKNFYIENHIQDSFMFFELFKEAKGALLDIGSGNGFPAIILTIICRKLHTTMIELNSKKCAFLRDTCLKLSLNAIVINENILNFENQEKFDFITIRGLRLNSSIETKLSSLIKKDAGSLIIWTYPPPVLKKFKLIKSISRKNKYLHLYIKEQVAQQPI